MPIYEYECPKHGKFEALKSMGERYITLCPECGEICSLVMSLSHFKMYNPFTKDGEGFTSETYNPKEADIRVEHNVPKEVSV